MSRRLGVEGEGREVQSDSGYLQVWKLKRGYGARRGEGRPMKRAHRQGVVRRVESSYNPLREKCT